MSGSRYLQTESRLCIKRGGFAYRRTCDPAVERTIACAHKLWNIQRLKEWAVLEPTESVGVPQMLQWIEEGRWCHGASPVKNTRSQCLSG